MSKNEIEKLLKNNRWIDIYKRSHLVTTTYSKKDGNDVLIHIDNDNLSYHVEIDGIQVVNAVIPLNCVFYRGGFIYYESNNKIHFNFEV